MRIVVALGGNALLKRGEPMSAVLQRRNVGGAADALVALIDDGHQIVVTHGNGPQVGLIALQSAAGPQDGNYPLDILGAESQGMIGYLIEQALRDRLPPATLLATLLTQVRVDSADPAFQHPTKPIGPIYGAAEAKALAAARAWTIAPDGDHWRRVAPSPEPLEILGLGAIQLLVQAGVVVISTGGGGIPVVARQGGGFEGVEAVIDKDRASSLLAGEIGADMLLMLTDVDAVYADFGKPGARAIASAGGESLRVEDFAAGSMGPKVAAAKRFAALTGKVAAIGRIEDAGAIVRQAAGTWITAGADAVAFRRETAAGSEPA